MAKNKKFEDNIKITFKEPTVHELRHIINAVNALQKREQERIAPTSLVGLVVSRAKDKQLSYQVHYHILDPVPSQQNRIEYLPESIMDRLINKYLE